MTTNPNTDPTSDVSAGAVTGQTSIPDRLIGGTGQTLSKAGILNAGTLPRGAILGKLTTGGNYALAAAASTDGSQTPNAILAIDCDASAGTAPCVVYVKGDFNAAACIYGSGVTEANAYDTLRDAGIYLVDVQPTSP